ncbi:MAG: STAS domain-containing protein [Methylococcaceae bacterium]|jgi:anti-anti-sigma factor|nr:STAS domain-containing protein [Methylococcaceae bacterium]
MLAIASTKNQDSLVISLDGRIDANSAKELEQQCMTWIDEGEKKLILDFSAVNFISSAGLRVILLIAKKLEPVQGKVKLCGLNATLRDVFEISGFSKLFDILPTVAEAL